MEEKTDDIHAKDTVSNEPGPEPGAQGAPMDDAPDTVDVKPRFAWIYVGNTIEHNGVILQIIKVKKLRGEIHFKII